MSKADKAEQRAFEAYPVLMCYNDFQMVEEDINKPLREIYQEGYLQAEKDIDIEYTRTDAFIEKACEWLSNMPLEDMEYKYDGFDTSEGWYRMIEDFRKYMGE